MTHMVLEMAMLRFPGVDHSFRLGAAGAW